MKSKEDCAPMTTFEITLHLCDKQSLLRLIETTSLPSRAVCEMPWFPNHGTLDKSPGIFMFACFLCCPFALFLISHFFFTSRGVENLEVWGRNVRSSCLANPSVTQGKPGRGWNVIFKARHFALVPGFRCPTPHPSSPLAVQNNHAPALWQLPYTYVLLIMDVCSLRVLY